MQDKAQPPRQNPFVYFRRTTTEEMIIDGNSEAGSNLGEDGISEVEQHVDEPPGLVEACIIYA